MLVSVSEAKLAGEGHKTRSIEQLRISASSPTFGEEIVLVLDRTAEDSSGLLLGFQ